MKGIILAGGKSSRFGEDKALAVVEGKTLLERALFLIRTLEIPPIVITSEARDYSFLDCRVENDCIPGKGPLGGLFTACSLFPSDSLLILTCDMPAVNTTILKEMIEAHGPEFKITAFQDDSGAPYPFPGIYEVSLQDVVRKRLGEGALSMQGMISAQRDKNLLPVRSSCTPLFQNVNRQQDLNSFLR